MGSDVPHDEVVIGTVSDDFLARLFKGSSHSSSVGDHLSAVCNELWGVNLLQLDGQGTNLVVVRASLEHGEYSKVNALKKFLLAEDDSRSGTSETLVSSGGDDVAEREGVSHLLSGNESADVSDIGHEIGTDAVSDCSEAGVFEVSGVATGATDEDVRSELGHSNFERVHVNQAGLRVDEVGPGFKVVGAGRNLLGFSLMTVGQVTTVGKRKTHQARARLEKASVHSEVGGGAGKRLHVNAPFFSVEAESLESTLHTEGLNLVDHLIAAIITTAGVALRILVS